MKKTTAMLAVLLSTAIAVPAQANDAVNIGIGILGLVINEATKNKGGNQRRPGKGDKLIGRVGEQPTRNSRARNQNKVAPAAAAGGAAVAVYALPEGDKAPIPEAKPTAEQMAAYEIQLASSSTSEEQFDESVPLHDELGRYWGAVAPADAEKVEAAVKLGMKPSVVIPEVTGLKLPEPEVDQTAVPVLVAEQPIPAVATVDEVETAEAIPEKTEEAIAVVPAMPSLTTTAETIVTPPVDTIATTASVTPEPKIEKPVEVEKPKAKLDL